MTEKYINAEVFKRRVMEAARIANKPVLYEIAEAICEMVDNSPAEDVLPVVHGEWEVTICENLPGVFRTGSPHCSVCGKTSPCRTAFCPNCFAKMDGGIIKPMKRAGDSAEKAAESLVDVIDAFENAEHCVCCGETVPEGRQVCPGCEKGEEEDV